MSKSKTTAFGSYRPAYKFACQKLREKVAKLEAELIKVGNEGSLIAGQFREEIRHRDERIKALEKSCVALQEAVNTARQDSVQHQIKTWSLALNRMGIGLTIRSDQVEFTKGAWAVSMPLNHILDESMHCIIAMLSKIPGNPHPFNEVDGVRGWKHPDTIQADVECAADKAAKMLWSAGAKPGKYTIEVCEED